MRILVRADGSFERGMGHVSKQITLCNRLKKLNHEVLFVANKNRAVECVLAKHRLNSIEIDGETLFNIDVFIGAFKPQLIVLDILNTRADYINGLKKHGVKIVTFDNTDESAFDCDLIFNIMYYHDPEIKRLYRVIRLKLRLL